MLRLGQRQHRSSRKGEPIKQAFRATDTSGNGAIGKKEFALFLEYLSFFSKMSQEFHLSRWRGAAGFCRAGLLCWRLVPGPGILLLPECWAPARRWEVAGGLYPFRFLCCIDRQSRKHSA